MGVQRLKEIEGLQLGFQGEFEGARNCDSTVSGKAHSFMTIPEIQAFIELMFPSFG